MDLKNQVKIFKALAVASTVACTVLCGFAPAAGGVASASPAPAHWDGVTSSCPVVADKDCPVNVESALLSFNVESFPETYYESAEEFLGYGGTVTTSYSLHNPSDGRVTVNLAHPLGGLPEYANVTDGVVDNTAKFSITADGGPVESVLRHTYAEYDTDLADVGEITEGYRAHKFFAPELAVTQYSFTFSHGYEIPVYTIMRINYDKSRTRIFTYYDNRESTAQGAVINFRVYGGDTHKIYCVGEPLTGYEFTYYVNLVSEPDCDAVEPAQCAASVERTEEGTLCEYAKDVICGQTAGVSSVDAYNAFIDSVSTVRDDGIFNEYFIKHCDLMRWYVFSIDFEPRASVMCEVKAPSYPHINGGYTPPLYEYSYLLSPFSGWKSFKNLEVRIYTPVYMLSSGLGGFEKTDYGYVFSSDFPPEGELSFSLCETDAPECVRLGGGSEVFLYFIAFNCIILGGVALIYLIAAAYMYIEYRIYKKRREGKNNRI